MNNENGNIRYITPADDRGLKALVGKAVASYGKARIAVQVAIVAILIHAAKHHDYSQANALVVGLGKTKTARDVAVFFQDFGGLSQKKEDGQEQPEGFNAWNGPDYIREHLDDAKATMFWEYKQPTGDVFRQYSLEEMARQFIQRHENAKKAAAKGKASLDDTLSETTMQAVLNLVKFERITADAGKGKGKADKPERAAA
jgi:hypothetical protein